MEFRTIKDLAPGLINSNVTSSGSSNSSAVSGSKYLQRSRGTDPLTTENHVWNCSGPSRITSLAVEAVDGSIENSGVAAATDRHSRNRDFLTRIKELYLRIASRCNRAYNC